MVLTGRTSRDSVRVRIVDAASGLIQEGGRGAVTTRAVSSRAGVQAPTIYRLFGDKSGLLDAVAEHVLATYVSTKASESAEAASAGLDPVTALRDAWDRQVDFGLANPHIFALLVDPRRSSPAGRAGLQVLAERIHRISAAGRLRIAEERAVELVHAAGVGVILTMLAMPPATRDPVLPGTMFDSLAAQMFTGTDAVEPRDDAASVVSAARRVGGLSDGESRLLDEWMRRGSGPPDRSVS